MTPQESARNTAVWTAQVVATFVVCGGFLGGALVGIGIPLLILLSSFSAPFAPVILLQLLWFPPMAGLYGVVVGLPAAGVTALTYIVSPAMRLRRRRLVAIGTAASAGWGAVLLEFLLASTASGPPLESYAIMVAIFAVCGAVATLGSLSLLKRWRLHRPT